MFMIYFHCVYFLLSFLSSFFGFCIFYGLFFSFLWGILGMIYYLRMRIVVYECGNSIISDYNVSDLSIAERDGCHVWYRNGQPFRGT